VLDQRGRLLRAALGFAGLPRSLYDRALHAQRAWLLYEAGPTRCRLKVKQPGWTDAEDRWQRRISVAPPAR
jgi:hypothetical protein